MDETFKSPGGEGEVFGASQASQPEADRPKEYLIRHLEAPSAHERYPGDKLPVYDLPPIEYRDPATGEFKGDGLIESQIGDVTTRFGYIYKNGQFELTSCVVTDANGEQRDLLAKLPQAYRVQFAPEAATGGGLGDYFIPARRNITVDGDLRQPARIVALAHEIGHAVDYEENLVPRGEAAAYQRSLLGFQQRRITYDILPPQDLALVLQEERNAWAFALQELKPFFREDWLTQQDVLRETHVVCLGGYSVGIRNALDLELRGEIAKKQKVLNQRRAKG